MPFSKEGIIPDLIVNPHAIPSRMTIGHLMETLVGKAGLVRSCGDLDGSPFNGTDVDDIGETLEHFGYEKTGTEVLYNGKTGEQITANIFIGPTYYQRLKHMVQDKIHSRAHGPVTVLTRQPTEGRSRSGALRAGEMERDAILGHGCATFLKERLFDYSDKYLVYVCKKCGLISIANPIKKIFKCLYCPENTNNFIQLRIPYATKLFIQEQMTMGILPRLKIE